MDEDLESRFPQLLLELPGEIGILETAAAEADAVKTSAAAHSRPGAQRNRPPLPPEAAGGPRIVPLAAMEKQVILRTIDQLKGDKLLAARLLGIGKTTLYHKLKEYASED